MAHHGSLAPWLLLCLAELLYATLTLARGHTCQVIAAVQVASAVLALCAGRPLAVPGAQACQLHTMLCTTFLKACKARCQAAAERDVTTDQGWQSHTVAQSQQCRLLSPSAPCAEPSATHHTRQQRRPTYSMM